MKKITTCIILILLFVSANISAQISQGGKPKSLQLLAKGSIPQFTTAEVDRDQLLIEDEEE